MTSLVELALAERDSKNAGVSFFLLFCRWDLGWRPRVPSGDRGNWDKNRDDFYCMQMSLVMSMRFIFGDDWNNAKCLSRFSAMAKFFLPCNKSRFFFFNKTGLGLRFMLI